MKLKNGIIIIILIVIGLLIYEVPLLKKVHTYERELGIELTENVVFNKSMVSDIESSYELKRQELINENDALASLISGDIDKIMNINDIKDEDLSQSQTNLLYGNILYIQTINEINNNSNIDFTSIDSKNMLDEQGLFQNNDLENEPLSRQQIDYLIDRNYTIDEIYNFYYEIRAVIEQQLTIQANNNLTCEPFYVQGILIVNKNHCLDSSYDPGGLLPETSEAFDKMQGAALNEGINIYASSGYRSYDEQVSTYNYWVSLYGEQEAMRVSAKPGYSEHQTGYVIDVGGENDACLLEECFGEEKEGIWLAQNAHKYGFIIRYKPGKEDITGYKYEPWHLRYVGVELATAIYQQDTTLEEYLNIR